VTYLKLQRTLPPARFSSRGGAIVSLIILPKIAGWAHLPRDELLAHEGLEVAHQLHCLQRRVVHAAGQRREVGHVVLNRRHRGPEALLAVDELHRGEVLPLPVLIPKQLGLEINKTSLEFNKTSQQLCFQLKNKPL
jgi:hypothetical protein